MKLNFYIKEELHDAAWNLRSSNCKNDIFDNARKAVPMLKANIAHFLTNNTAHNTLYYILYALILQFCFPSGKNLTKQWYNQTQNNNIDILSEVSSSLHPSGVPDSCVTAKPECSTDEVQVREHYSVRFPTFRAGPSHRATTYLRTIACDKVFMFHYARFIKF
ncbi:hypothetical protein J6590_086483 [Homalodisca vitripennis]|nr:hypothetical protein J6590_086483 [Homalodisca vitripennis]